MTSVIDFSAEFGGRDAAQYVLPQFYALKRAAKKTSLASFPFPKLAFILRVDGEVHSYGMSGAGYVDFDKKGEYVSVDIGITEDDRHSMSIDGPSSLIEKAIVSAVEVLMELSDERLSEVDFAELERTLRDLCSNYRASFE